MSIETLLGASVGAGPSFTFFRLSSSAASVNATLLKGSGSRVFRISGFNTSASVKYLKLYNVSGTPVVGTDTPRFIMPLPPTAAFNLEGTMFGFNFPTGLGIGITGLAVESDTTAVAAGDITALGIVYL